MLQGNIICYDLAAALTMACSAARLATLLGIVPRATVEVEEADTVADTAEEDTEEVQAVEEAEVCYSSYLQGLLAPSPLCVYLILIPRSV